LYTISLKLSTAAPKVSAILPIVAGLAVNRGEIRQIFSRLSIVADMA